MSRCALWIVGGVALLNVLAFRGVGPLDDDFIFYRYAEGLLERGELAYNPGERVEGFVAPLWLLLLSATTALGIAPWWASQALGVAGALGAVLGLASLWMRRHPGRFPVPALLLATLPALGFHALSGLGTTCVAFALVMFALAWQRALEQGSRGWAAGLWLGAASLLRPEAIVFALAFSVVELRRRRLASVLCAWGPGVLWTVFRVAYFGTWLPHPFHMKRLGFLTDLRYGIEYLAGATLEVGAGLWCLVGLLALLPALRKRGSDRLHAALLVGWLLHAVVVVLVGGDYMRFSRLFLPALPLALFSTWHVLAGFTSSVSAAGRRPPAYLLLGALLFLAPQASQHMRRGAAQLHADQEGRWKRVGGRLSEITAEGDRIAASPIGCIGYLSRRPMVDMLGLTHDGLLDVAPDLAVKLKAHHRFDAEWVLSRDPALVVPSNGGLRLESPFFLLWERDLLMHPSFLGRYRALELQVPGSYPLVYYARRDLPLPAGAREVPSGG